MMFQRIGKFVIVLSEDFVMFDKYFIKKVNQSFIFVEDYNMSLLENYNNHICNKMEYVTMDDINTLNFWAFSDIIVNFCKKYSYIVVAIIEKKDGFTYRYTCWNKKYYKDEMLDFNIIENVKDNEFIISLFIDIDAIEFLGNSVYKDAHVLSGIFIEKVNSNVVKLNRDVKFINLNSNYITKKMGYNVNELLFITSFKV